MKIDTSTQPVDDLLTAIDRQEVALPEFQRNFVWKPTQIADLLRTVARKWPAGSLLLMASQPGEAEFGIKSIDGAPAADGSKVRLFVLDGQQRLTSIYQVLTDKCEEVYFVELLTVNREGFDDDHLRFMKRSRFVKKYPSVKSMAEDGVIPIHMIWDDLRFNEWQSHLGTEDDRRASIESRSKYLPGFRGYDLPAVVLPTDVEFAAVAKIFETLNKTGTKLDVFDLMVARLYPHEFNLRDKWVSVLGQSSLLERYGVEGIDVLRLIALRDCLGGGGSKGVRQSDVLSLSPEFVKQSWGEAVDAVERSLEFLRGRLGAVSPALIPSPTMLLPLADSLWGGQGEEEWLDRLEAWAWRAALGNAYGQGANTQAVADAKELRAWAQSDSATPKLFQGFRVHRDVLRDARRRNESVLRAILCLCVMADARDWLRPSKRILDLSEALEVHHVFPKKFLQSRGEDGEDGLLNFAVVMASTNASLRNDPPSQVLERKEIDASAVATHCIDVSALESDNWSDFLDAREQSVIALLHDRLGIEVAEAES